jgi:hypothetical protein
MKTFKQLLILGLSSLINFYYSLFKKDYYNRHHLEITLENERLQLNWCHHDEYVLYKEAELSRLQKDLEPNDFIYLALREARQCNFIIFDCGDDKRFVQFWLGDDDSMVSWILMKRKNKLDKYVYPMLGVLNELDITQRPTKVGGLFKTKYQFYELKQEEGFDDYQIHFANNYDEASLFVSKIFTDVFGQDLKKLQFKLG